MRANIGKSLLWLSLLACIVFVITIKQPNSNTNNIVTNDQLQQNMLAKGSKIVQFQYDTDGQLIRSLKAQKVIDFDQAPQKLYFPSFIAYQNQQARWQVSSELAELENEIIYLQNNVTIDQLNHIDPLQLITEQLDYHLISQFAQGTQSVLISNLQSTSEGTGIEAQFSAKNSYIKLLNNVKSTYYD